jgi:beta-lactamase class A
MAGGRRVGYRVDERFPLCSTYKLLAAALVLARVDRSDDSLDRRIAFSKMDLVIHSPVTKRHIGLGGMSLSELCEAAIRWSDNTAGNLLLASFGGPPALTAFVRTLGDEITRLDRIETALNEAAPGDLRDTTTPAAMLNNMQRLLVGDTLSAVSRGLLTGWLLHRAGARRLRAGFPADWRVGDKTGDGSNATTNDIAIAWPPDRAPILVAAYYTGSTIGDRERDMVIAEACRLTIAGLT